MDDKNKKEDQQGERGVALMITLVAVAVMMTLISDLIVTSNVGLELAFAQRDRVKAEYAAKSGVNLAEYFLSISYGYDLFRASPAAPDAVKKNPPVDSRESLWGQLNSLPPMGAQMVELVKSLGGFADLPSDKDDKGKDKDKSKEKSKDSDSSGGDDPFKLKGLMGEDNAKIMKYFEDQFIVKIEDESGKINLNNCVKGRCLDTITQLVALFSCPVEKEFLTSKKITPEQLAYRIKDYITDSANASPESGFSNKDDPYSNKKPPYKAKNVGFDSVDELKLIEGWDAEIHKIFEPFVTAFPFTDPSKKDGKALININVITPALLACLIPQALEESCKKTFLTKMNESFNNSTALSDADIGKTLSDVACYKPKAQEGAGSGSTGQQKTPDSGGDPAAATAPPVDPGSDDPITWFGNTSSVYKVIGDAQTGSQGRVLEVILHKTPAKPQNALSPADNSGTAIQPPPRKAFEILHWQLR